MNSEPLAAQGLLFALAGADLPGWNEFAQTVRLRRVARGGQLFAHGVPNPFVYVVRRGLLKLVYVAENGDEWVKSFIGEGQFFASLAALAPGGTTSFVAEAIEDAELEQLDHREITRRARLSLPWQTALAQALLIYGARKEARERELLTLAPAERYRLLLSQSPGIVERVLQKDLARYLGVTPVSLSRLKAKERTGAAQGNPPTR